MPVKASAQGKPAVSAATPRDIGNTPATSPADPGSDDASSPFNQLIAKIVADGGGAQTAQTPADPLATASADTVKLPTRRVIPWSDRSALPALDLPPLARFADVKFTPPAVVQGRSIPDTRDLAPPKHDKTAQPQAVPVDISVPIPVSPKLQLMPVAGDGVNEEKALKVVAPANPDKPAVMALQPKPMLEVIIHLDQPEASKAGTLPAQILSGQTVSGQTVSGRTVSGQTVSGQTGSGQTVSGQTVPGQTVPDQTVSDETVSDETATTSDGKPSILSRANTLAGAIKPEPADVESTPDATAHATPRIAGNRDAAVVVQHQTAAIAATPAFANNPANTHAEAVPASPTTVPVPTTARETGAAPELNTAPMREEPPIEQPKTQQPMRSLSLEFTPDGSRDIKVRLSERAGDVHISVHGTDASLEGRVREGVSDLVGSLSKAGYDAEAWTPDQGRQNQRQQSEQRKATRSSGEAGGAVFNGILQQPIQEIS